MKKIGINGFGRIGRGFARIALTNPTIDVCLVNDLADINTLAHLLKYDSIHGQFSLSFHKEGNDLIFENGKRITFTQIKQALELPWKSYGIDTVIESTGIYLSKEKVSEHLQAGAKKVIISAPALTDDIPTVVLGVNESTVDFNSDILSNASCTTNNSASLISVLRSILDIQVAYISTIHSYTSDQRLHDAPHKDLRRARAAAQSIVPTSTGAAKAITKIFPDLEGKVTGGSVRVPVIDGSMTELTVITPTKITASEINAAMKNASEGSLKGILAYTEDPIVSSDIIGHPASCIFDADLTLVFNNLVKVVGWYDNETGYANRLVELAKRF
ncbi:MAG: type I glyceraldehyde-3-phosphate dehydrogenase [Bacteroidetes bacterium]|nr:type I glyceraldehyde-3-phosphate dehydrogenase [Bacteroidota bacterium]